MSKKSMKTPMDKYRKQYQDFLLKNKDKTILPMLEAFSNPLILEKADAFERQLLAENPRLKVQKHKSNFIVEEGLKLLQQQGVDVEATFKSFFDGSKKGSKVPIDHKELLNDVVKEQINDTASKIVSYVQARHPDPKTFKSLAKDEETLFVDMRIAPLTAPNTVNRMRLALVGDTGELGRAQEGGESEIAKATKGQLSDLEVKALHQAIVTEFPILQGLEDGKIIGRIVAETFERGNTTVKDMVKDINFAINLFEEAQSQHKKFQAFIENPTLSNAAWDPSNSGKYGTNVETAMRSQEELQMKYDAFERVGPRERVARLISARLEQSLDVAEKTVAKETIVTDSISQPSSSITISNSSDSPERPKTPSPQWIKPVRPTIERKESGILSQRSYSSFREDVSSEGVTSSSSDDLSLSEERQSPNTPSTQLVTSHDMEGGQMTTVSSSDLQAPVDRRRKENTPLREMMEPLPEEAKQQLRLSIGNARGSGIKEVGTSTEVKKVSTPDKSQEPGNGLTY